MSATYTLGGAPRQHGGMGQQGGGAIIMLVELKPHLIVEDVGTEVLICDPTDALVHRLDGHAAELVRSIGAASQPIDCPMTTSLAELLDAGIVTKLGERHGELVTSGRTMSRRSMMGLGAVATAAGIVTLALPEAAAAVSVEGFGDIGITPAPIVPPNFATTNAAQFLLDVPGGELAIRWRPGALSPFTYGWSVRSGSHTGPVLASGVLTSSNDFSPTLFTAGVGQTIYVSVASNTDPVYIFRRVFTN